MRSAKRGSCISVDYRFSRAPPTRYPFIDIAKIAIFRDMTKCSRCYLHLRKYVMQHLLENSLVIALGCDDRLGSDAVALHG